MQHRTTTHVNPENPAEKVTVLVAWCEDPNVRYPTIIAEYTAPWGTGYRESRLCGYTPADPELTVHKMNCLLLDIRTAVESAYTEATDKYIPWPRERWLSDWSDLFPEWGVRWDDEEHRFVLHLDRVVD